MKIITRFFAAGLIVLLAACNKKEDVPVVDSFVPNNAVLASTAIPPDPALNKQNPYDYVGYYHNITLDSLRHYVKSSGDTSRLATYAYISRYFKNNFGADVRLSYDPNEKLACSDYKALWFNQKISAAAMAYWHSLSDAVQGIKDLEHYNGYKQQIVAIENKIDADKLAAEEKKNLLMTASILRYSGYYWINAFNKGDVVYHNEGSGMAMPDSFLRKIAGVITGIAADASILAFSSFCGDPDFIGMASDMSYVCGYYTGWW